LVADGTGFGSLVVMDAVFNGLLGQTVAFVEKKSERAFETVEGRSESAEGGVVEEAVGNQGHAEADIGGDFGEGGGESEGFLASPTGEVSPGERLGVPGRAIRLVGDVDTNGFVRRDLDGREA
jgi:hypothetical protein